MMLLIFGAVFFGGGVWALGLGLKIIPTDPAKVNGPYWVPAATGVLFAMSGIWIWSGAWREAAAKRRFRRAERMYPGDPAMRDFGWEKRGFAARRWRSAMRASTGAVLMIPLLAVVNWAVFANDAPLFVKLGIGVFDLILVLVVWTAALRIGRTIRFGGSRVLFTRFPYRLGEPVEIDWQPPVGLGRAEKGAFTLRCVREFRTSLGNNSRKHLAHERIWASVWELGEAMYFNPAQPVRLAFEAPEDLPSTRLHASDPIFWELEVKLERPGLDFVERYLVPVYERAEVGSTG